MMTVIILGFLTGKKMKVDIFPGGNCLLPCGVDFPPFLVPQFLSLSPGAHPATPFPEPCISLWPPLAEGSHPKPLLHSREKDGFLPARRCL